MPAGPRSCSRQAQPTQSLMRMIGPSGNPRANNFLEVIGFPKRCEQVRFHVKSKSD